MGLQMDSQLNPNGAHRIYNGAAKGISMGAPGQFQRGPQRNSNGHPKGSPKGLPWGFQWESYGDTNGSRVATQWEFNGAPRGSQWKALGIHIRTPMGVLTGAPREFQWESPWNPDGAPMRAQWEPQRKSNATHMGTAEHSQGAPKGGFHGGHMGSPGEFQCASQEDSTIYPNWSPRESRANSLGVPIGTPLVSLRGFNGKPAGTPADSPLESPRGSNWNSPGIPPSDPMAAP